MDWDPRVRGFRPNGDRFAVVVARLRFERSNPFRTDDRDRDLASVSV